MITEHSQHEHDFVVFNGDIFELFIHNFNHFQYSREALPLTEWMFYNPHRFVFIPGNHDESLWSIEEDLFFPIYSMVKIKQAGKEIVCMHGHQFDVINRRTTWLTRLLYFGEYLSNRIFGVNWQDLIFRQRKYFYRFADYKRRTRLPVTRENARQYAKTMGYKTLVHGHTHFANDDNGVVRVIDGGGFQVGTSYVTIENGKCELIQDC